MQKVFENPGEVEKNAKAKLCIPDFMMMENAARSLGDFIKKLAADFSLKTPDILILCGKGNNGGDGYALARHLYETFNVKIVTVEKPVAAEALAQFQMCDKLGLLESDEEEIFEPEIIVDCLYGIGFHGELEGKAKELLDYANSLSCIKVACDVPSGLRKDGSCSSSSFKADYTVTMGCLKLGLYSDGAKELCGKIIPVGLGISRSDFEKFGSTNTYLIDSEDIQLPLRNNPIAHKGTYGHTAVITGEKAGAGIIAGTASIAFGSGLTTLVKTKKSNLEQFRISPSLMLAEALPRKTSAIVLGPGLGEFSEKDCDFILDWFSKTENPALVLDADIFSKEYFISFLKRLNAFEKARIILTPHILEFNRLLLQIQAAYPEAGLTEEELCVKSLTSSSALKIKLGKLINDLFPKTTLVIKSANTFIASNGETYIVNNGCESLAKGGSGDVLAGMTAALLAQGYSGIDAAITACYTHGKASNLEKQNNYSLNPEILIERIAII